MSTERDELVRLMRQLTEKAKELTNDYLGIVEEFHRVQKQIQELDRKEGRDRLP